MPDPVVDESKCTGCATCAEICPMACFEIDSVSKKAKVTKPGDCIGCKACEVQCPAACIVVND